MRRPRRSQRLVALGLVGLLVTWCPATRAADSPSAGEAGASESLAGTRSESLSRLARYLVLAALPPVYEDKRKWGLTAERWDGLKVERDGWRIKTKRRKKEVNHGLWKMYRIRVLDPENSFQLHVHDVRQLEDGRAACDVTIVSPLSVFGRVSKWEKGVQLYSFSADADARVKLRLECRFALRSDPTKLPPDLILEPEIAGAQIELLDFRLRRISDLRGPLVKQLGEAMEDVLEDRLEDQERKIPAKINRQIAKKQDRLRLSLQDAMKRVVLKNEN